jgi:hypothetical protein
MNFRPVPAKHPWSFLWALSALAIALPTAFSGCMGGTTTEGGNPSISVEFREAGRPAAFSGVIMAFEKNANPEFQNPDPDDGGNPPMGGEEGPEAGVADLVIPLSRSVTLDLKLLSGSLHRRPIISLGKTSAQAATGTMPEYFPDFNLVFIANGGKMSILSGIHLDRTTGNFVSDAGGPGESQIMDVNPWRDYSGTVDTTTEAGKPIALFVPGTNFYAKVRNGKFLFEGLPSAKMPLRWVSALGIVRTMPDSLGQTWAKPLLPGERVDSIPMPKPMVEVQLPSATPPGHFAFTDSVIVLLASETGAAIYYTLDGSTPDNGSTLYTAPLLLRSSTTLKSVAYIKGRDHSAVSVNNYTLVPMEPIASPTGKGFRDSLLVTLASPYPGATLYYTLDGTDPGINSVLFSGQPIRMTASTTLKAMADVPGLGQSRALTEKYILVTDSLAVGD